MDGVETDGQKKRAGGKARGRKQPRKISPRYLENAALHYLKRYAATEKQLERVLLRRIDRSIRVHGGDRGEMSGWVAALIQKLVRNGLLNDTAYTSMKAKSLRASGRSARLIAQKLMLKGVGQNLVKQKVEEVVAELPEVDAARIWARKKRLGPFRRTASERKEKRQRDLAALARAGFSFQVARAVIDGD